jgi:protein-disulfide isomerase
VTIVECGDFGCPFTQQARATVARITELHPEVAVYWLNNPLPAHACAEAAARASIAAARQGAFWPFADLLLETFGQQGEDCGDPTHADTCEEDDLVALATTAGLDPVRFREALHDPAIDQTLAEQIEVCRGNGATATPTFFIGDDLLRGAQPLENFLRIIEEEQQAVGEAER